MAGGAEGGRVRFWLEKEEMVSTRDFHLLSCTGQPQAQEGASLLCLKIYAKIFV